VTVRRSLWLGFSAFIAYGATVPFRWVPDAGHAFETLKHLPLSPFVSPETGGGPSASDVIQNILLFLPFGALGLLAGDAARPILRSLTRVTAAGIALSVGVETVQLFTIDRVPATSDVLTDAVGCVLGASLAARFRHDVERAVGRLRAAALADAPEFRTLAIAATVLVVAWWQPFDLTLDVGSLSGKAHRLRADVWQFWGWHRQGTAIMLSAFLAMAMASYLSVLGARHPGLTAAVTTTTVLFALEAGQMCVASRMPGLADQLVAAAGAGLGSAVWTLSTRIAWPGLWLGVLALMTLGAAVLQTPPRGRPAAAALDVIIRVVDSSLLYFPLGYWIGQAERPSLRAYGRAAFMMAAIAAVAWTIQFWIHARRPEFVTGFLGLPAVLLGVRIASSEV
jgi:VanZ family protein